MITFAHLSDCHIGGWREHELRQLSLQSFSAAVDLCIQHRVDFVVIAGDLFNTSVPSIDAMKTVASGMKKLNDHGIRVYVIPGSHDYSPSGKTILDVLERSGLCVNVFKFDHETQTLSFTVDEKTGVHLVGMPGLRGGLEKFHYEKLKKQNLEQPCPGPKIFLFHSLITEFKPADFEMIDSEPLMSLPKNFHYYAGGHPHFVFQKDMTSYGYGLASYPGPLFPNNFKEIEQLKHGSFNLVTLNDDRTCKAVSIPVNLKTAVSYDVNAEGKTPAYVSDTIRKHLQDPQTKDALVTFRIHGCLAEGKTSDINFAQIFHSNHAYAILKNTYKLTSKEYQDIDIHHDNVHDIEEHFLKEYLQKKAISFFGHTNNEELTRTLMHFLDKEKHDGERTSDFSDRILSDALKQLRIGEKA